ncbi:YoaK family protein [Pseudarthrobacter sp. J64]|uniref:YoaK family protein n=1 Tax=Pseudarthrobacter sp. J64 TaxID=3116485 RepID=UPI002E80F3BF|nr:YoaK family protein [Pseudarthrobacter sp. J64]MEE2569070.1 YoaK family protein [Pseudarthrobacter sp. J64]
MTSAVASSGTKTASTPQENASPEKFRLILMMALTLVTGVVDAVGYLGLDHIFTGNMTGNVVILAMALAGAANLPTLGPLVALGAFLLGAAVAGSTLQSSPKGWNRRVTLLLTAGCIALTGTAATSLIVEDVGRQSIGVIVAAVIAMHMGSQALIARHLGVRDMTTVVITSTMTSLAGESLVGKQRPRLLNRRLGAVLAMFAGAAIGVPLLQIHLSVPIGLGIAITAAVTVLGSRRWH